MRPGTEPALPYRTMPYWTCWTALVEERGRVPAAQGLGVNHRTLAICCDSRQVSLRMRRALLDFRNRGGETENGDGDAEALARRVSHLEDEKCGLRELADERACHLEELRRRVARLEDIEANRALKVLYGR